MKFLRTHLWLPRCVRKIYMNTLDSKNFGAGTLLRKAIEHDKIGSLIFYGPPGAGKTTLAEIIAKTTAAHFVPMSAITAGKSDIMKVVDEASDSSTITKKKPFFSSMRSIVSIKRSRMHCCLR